MSKARGDWTDDEIEALRELWPKGSSEWVAAALKERFGTRFRDAYSRNMVLGKAHRIGLMAKRKHERYANAAPPRKRVRKPSAPTVLPPLESQPVTTAANPPLPSEIAAPLELFGPRELDYSGEPLPVGETREPQTLADHIPEAERIRIWNMSDRQCRFSIGHDGFHFFCGEPTPVGKSLCEHHHALSWVRNRNRGPVIKERKIMSPEETKMLAMRRNHQRALVASYRK